MSAVVSNECGRYNNNVHSGTVCAQCLAGGTTYRATTIPRVHPFSSLMFTLSHHPFSSPFLITLSHHPFSCPPFLIPHVHPFSSPYLMSTLSHPSCPPPFSSPFLRTSWDRVVSRGRAVMHAPKIVAPARAWGSLSSAVKQLCPSEATQSLAARLRLCVRCSTSRDIVWSVLQLLPVRPHCSAIAVGSAMCHLEVEVLKERPARPAVPAP
jgi:hypothetical protein